MAPGNSPSLLLSQELINYINNRIQELKDDVFNSEYDEHNPIEYLKQQHFHKGLVAAFLELLSVNDRALLPTTVNDSDFTDLTISD